MIETHLSILFCHHTQEAFTLGFIKLFSKTNIFVIESGFDDGTASNLERAFKKLSEGQLTPEQMRKNTRADPEHPDYGFFNGLQATIYKSNRTIILMANTQANSDLSNTRLLRNGG